MTQDFARRTRARIAATREAIAKLHEAGKETMRQAAKIDKQHATDRERVYDHLGQLADDVVDKLPAEASSTDADQARAIQDRINDLASNVEEVSLAGSAFEDLGGVLNDTIKGVYTALKEAESQLAKMELLGVKLGI